MNHTSNPMIVPENFIQATRDSGYKSFGAAVAELIDNSFQANAHSVSIFIRQDLAATSKIVVSVSDDGDGMNALTLRNALRFGWSSRFNDRRGTGRYGMGLPNASLSHARRVEVWSSADGEHAAGRYLDIDDHFPFYGKIDVARAAFCNVCRSGRGTVVFLKSCDRLEPAGVEMICQTLVLELGRIFRYLIWEGRKIIVNNSTVLPIDALFLRGVGADAHATRFGPDLCFNFTIPGGRCGGQTSQVRVMFAELPIASLFQLSNSSKSMLGITKRAGVSVVRAGREVDYGWLFMGAKRKENYDDWWRCEVHFEPDLDELFGVTNTKQRVFPTEPLSKVLTPAIEKIARELNGRVRTKFMALACVEPKKRSEKVAGLRDPLLDPPIRPREKTRRSENYDKHGCRGRIAGFDYKLCYERALNDGLYTTTLNDRQIRVNLNSLHPFVTHYMRKLDGPQRHEVELFILAAARAELTFAQATCASTIQRFKQKWSQTLAAFLR